MAVENKLSCSCAVDDPGKVDGVKYRDDQQPRQLFVEALLDFYKKMDQEAFWFDDNAKKIALQAFTQDYMRTIHDDHSYEDSCTFRAALSEFWMRFELMSPVVFSSQINRDILA